MSDYALGICQLCSVPMQLSEIEEGVVWLERSKHWVYGYYWLSEDDDVRVAHRRCWKGLAEETRREIRQEADELPRSMGQPV